MQASADTVVDNKAQDDFAIKANNEWLTKVDFEGSRHELFFETDDIRTQVMTQVRYFLGN